MNFADWYTDLMEIRRVRAEKEGALTRRQRVAAAENIPCRIYQSKGDAIRMSQTAARVQQRDKLACAVTVDVRAGDELIIRRGGALNKPGPMIRAFAAEPTLYYEPAGGASLGLEHQEIPLEEMEIVKGEMEDGTETEAGTAEESPL